MNDADPLTVTVQQAVNLTGLRHTTVWKLLREGRLERVKVGTRTLVTYASLRKLVEPIHKSLHKSDADCGDGGRRTAKDKLENIERNSRVSRSRPRAAAR